METKINDLTNVENETTLLLNELTPIINELFGDYQQVFFFEELDDSFNSELLKLTWGSLEYIKKLNDNILFYVFSKKCAERFFKVKETINYYKIWGNKDLLNENELNSMFLYIYHIYMINNLSKELKCLLIEGN
jgi:hypothetical protein